MNKIRNIAGIILISILLIVSSAISFADVVPKVYDGYDYTVREVITVMNTSVKPITNLMQNIRYDKRGDSLYQQNMNITYSVDSNNAVEVKNNDTKDDFSRELMIGTLYPNQQVTYTINRTFYNGKIDYGINADEFNNYKYDTKVFDKYLEPEYEIESDDPQIINKTKEIVGDETNPYYKAKKIFAFVNTYIKYDYSEANKGALNALITRKGVCEEYTKLFIAMCRAAGVPARRVNGMWINYTGNSGIYYKLDNIFHTWPEIYLPNSWMIVEPTQEFNNRTSPSWDTFLKDLKGSHFIGGYDSNVAAAITSYINAGDYKTYFWSSDLDVKRSLSIIKMPSKIEEISNFLKEAEDLNFNNYYRLKQLIDGLPESNMKNEFTDKLSQINMLQKCFSYDAIQKDVDDILKNIDLFSNKSTILSKLKDVQININKRNIMNIQNDKINIKFVEDKTLKTAYSFGIDTTEGVSRLTIYYNGIIKVKDVSDYKGSAVEISSIKSNAVIIHFSDKGASLSLE